MKDPKKATEFTVAKLLDGETWLKESRIPYKSGL
jgi:pectinesterase